MTEAVIFDYGLTLVDFEYPRECLLAMLARVRPWLGRDAATPADLMARVLEPLEHDVQSLSDSLEEAPFWPLYENAWRRAGLEPGRDVLERILDLEQSCWDRAVRVAEGAPSLLRRLRRRGLRTALCSNAVFPHQYMRRQLARNGLDRLLDAAVFSSELGRRKPAPEMYLAALAAVDTPADAALFVGDKVAWDYEAPRRLGLRAVICTQLRPNLKVPEGVPTIARLEEVMNLL